MAMNFIILKVNGIDVSNYPHEEAVKIFLNAPEPIVIEVKRRPVGHSNGGDSEPSDTLPAKPRLSPQHQSVASQTSDEWLREKMALLHEYSNFEATAREEEIEVEMVENEFDEDEDDEEGLSPDIDIEEITLRKSNSDERLGLTVSYSVNTSSSNAAGSSSDTEPCVEVFIADINSESVAGIDGRLKKGDQILQVNGRDVTNREETELLFAENKNAVTLLVSRCIQYSNIQSDLLDDSQSNLYYVHQDFSGRSEHYAEYDPTNVETPKTLTKDPLHHTNIRAHIEAVNQELAVLDSRMETALNLNGLKVGNVAREEPPTKFQTEKKRKPPTIPHIPAPPLESDTEHIYETIPEDIEVEPLYCSPYESAGGSGGGGSIGGHFVEQWLKFNNQGQAVAAATGRKPRRGCDNNGDGTTLNKKCGSSGEDPENSSSAYNTGGSCNSNQHLTLNLLSPSADRDTRRSTLVLWPPEPARPKPYQTMPLGGDPDPCAKCSRHVKPPKEKSSPKHQKVPGTTAPTSPNSPSSKLPKASTVALTASSQLANSLCSSQAPPLPPPPLMSSANANKFALQQTLQMQQKIFRQAFMQSNAGLNSGSSTLVGTSTTFKNFTAPSLSQYQFVSGCTEMTPPPPQQVYRTSLQPRTNEENTEWKVKRRQDGSRYIVRVRRPIRSRLLKDRARLLNEERSADITTEDDTISEVKLGKYWTKEERKKHVEKARDTRRIRQETMCASKNQQLLDDNPPRDFQQLRGTVPSCSRSNHPNRLSNPLPSSVSAGNAGISGANKKTLKKKHEEGSSTPENGGECGPGSLSLTTV